MKPITLNQKLGAVAFSMAFLAFLLSFTNPDGINDANKSPHYLSVIDLADKIKNRAPIEVIDLRSEALFEEFHIPTAKHMPLEQVIELTKKPGDPIVFYSGDDPLPRQLWRQLPDEYKKNSFILYGGVHDWYERLLYPELPLKPTDGDALLYHKIHELSLFYGGQPEFIEDYEVIKYYQQDFGQLPWPKSHRQNGLVRKGC